jgi:hypothetical protein
LYLRASGPSETDTTRFSMCGVPAAGRVELDPLDPDP